MKELQPTQEQLINDFAFELAMIDTPCDMFPDLCPPDESGVREPRRPVLPTLSGADGLTLAAVYDLSVARSNRREIMKKSGAVILRINQLVGV